jgi:hypothetical protein
MMSAETVKGASDLLGKIEQTKCLAAVYRKAAEITVGTTSQGFSRSNSLENTVTLSAAEIGDHIVAALERRSAQMRDEPPKAEP